MEWFVAYQAWLDTCPSNEDTRTNRQILLEREERSGKPAPALENEPILPEAAEYLVETLYTIGPVLSGSLGARPIDFSDLDAWVRVTGFRLEIWEAKALILLSRSYISQQQEARDGGPAPRREPLSQDERKSVMEGLRSMLDGRANASSKTNRKGRR